MKKLFAVTLLIAGFAAGAYAQQVPSKQKESRKEVRKKMKDELNLSREQAKDLKGINEEFKQKAKVIKDSETLTKAQKKAQLEVLHKERMAKINTILTPEQQEKMNKMKQASHSRKHFKKARTTR